MIRSVVGLFNDKGRAQAVAQELISQGLPKDRVELIAQDGEGAGDGHGKGFFARLGEMLGIESEDEGARSYSAGVERGGTLVVARVPDEQIGTAVAIFERNGAVDIDERGVTRAGAATTQRQQQVQQSQQAAQSTSASNARETDVALPVIEEELRVGKRVVQRGGVRVYTHVSERPVEQQVRLREEHVSVERRPVDRPVSEADLRGLREGTFEVAERAEEVVVSKQARVVEEVVVSKQVGERTEAVRDTVRRTDVEVEQLGADRAAAYETYGPDFQRHFSSTFARSGGTFDQYAPAYRYGCELAGNPRYRGADWGTFEADARRDWEAKSPGTWERMKDAVRYAWERVTGGASSESHSAR